jgi:hypothetical protein
MWMGILVCLVPDFLLTQLGTTLSCPDARTDSLSTGMEEMLKLLKVPTCQCWDGSTFVLRSAGQTQLAGCLQSALSS